MVPQHLKHACRQGVVALASVLCLAWAVTAHARHPDLELDDLSDDQLDALLQAELDDDDLIACGIGNPRQAVDDEKLVRVIMCALGDAGDTGSERALDLDDLEAEMEEAGTTVEEVVRQAIEEADELAQGPRGGAVMVRAAFRSGEDWFAFKDGRVNPASAAVGPVKTDLIAAVRAVAKKN